MVEEYAARRHTDMTTPVTRPFALALIGATWFGCAVAPDARFDELSRRFVYRVPFEIGKCEQRSDDSVEIAEVWGTRPKIEPGGDYLVVGTCRLTSAEHASVDLGLTAENWPNQRTGADLATKAVGRG